MENDSYSALSDPQLRRALERHGCKPGEIDGVVAARTRMRVRMLAHIPAQTGGTEMSEGFQMIQAALQDVGGQVKEYRAKTAEEIGQVGQRLLNVEQIVAKIDQEGGSFDRALESSIGSAALPHFAEDAQFQAASAAATRGMQPSQFNARINLDRPIQAALVGEGWATTSDLEVPSQPQRGPMRGPVFAPMRLIQALPSRSVSSDSVEFIQIDVGDDAADYQLKQGDEKAEIKDIEGTLKRAYIATIAGHTTASRQVLADHQALAQQIDRIIRNKVLSKLEHEIMNGTGAPGEINGLLNQSTTLVPSVASTPADVIGESITTQSMAGFRPSLVVLNPWDWFELQIEKDSLGRYMFGSPTSPMNGGLWGGRVVLTPTMPQGEGLTIDTNHVTVLDREQMTVMASNSHEDYFTRNLVKILGELRAGLEVIDTRAVLRFDLAVPPPTS